MAMRVPAGPLGLPSSKTHPDAAETHSPCYQKPFPAVKDGEKHVISSQDYSLFPLGSVIRGFEEERTPALLIVVLLR
jgi:hypothetical protein